MRVLVGRGGCGVRVRVGRGVLVAGGRGVLVNVARGTSVLAVKVMNGIGVCVGVRVLVGVRVGVRVREGVSEAVWVGAVDVGKGPNSACDVSATAVRVLLAFRCVCVMSGVSRDASA